MEDKIIRLIEEKGPEIANTLKIASEQVYSTVLWYVRINGAINLIVFTITLLISIILGVKVHKVIKKNEGYDSYSPWGIGVWFGYAVGLIVLWVIVDGMATELAKIIAPEYWIINQIVQKIGQ